MCIHIHVYIYIYILYIHNVKPCYVKHVICDNIFVLLTIDYK